MAYLDVLEVRYTKTHRISTIVGLGGEPEIKKEQLFLCINGPFEGQMKAESEVYASYTRYNSAGKFRRMPANLRSVV